MSKIKKREIPKFGMRSEQALNGRLDRGYPCAPGWRLCSPVSLVSQVYHLQVSSSPSRTSSLSDILLDDKNHMCFVYFVSSLFLLFSQNWSFHISTCSQSFMDSEEHMFTFYDLMHFIDQNFSLARFFQNQVF